MDVDIATRMRPLFSVDCLQTVSSGMRLKVLLNLEGLASGFQALFGLLMVQLTKKPSPTRDPHSLGTFPAFCDQAAFVVEAKS